MTIKRHHFLIFGALTLVLSVALYIYDNQPRSIEYIKENPEHYRLDRFWSVDSARRHLAPLLRPGIHEATIDKVVLHDPRVQKSAKWHYPENSSMKNVGISSNRYFVYYILNHDDHRNLYSRYILAEFTPQALLISSRIAETGYVGEEIGIKILIDEKN